MTTTPRGTASSSSLARIHVWILVGWAAVALAMTVVTLVAATGAEGWGTLVAAVGILLFVWAVIVLVVVALIARFAVKGHTARTWTVVLGPPALLFAAMFLTRGVG